MKPELLKKLMETGDVKVIEKALIKELTRLVNKKIDRENKRIYNLIMKGNKKAPKLKGLLGYTDVLNHII
jgi:hypothetical protein